VDEPKCTGRHGASAHASHIPADLLDEALLQDIELLTHVMADLTARRCPLTARQVDRLLGVEPGGAAGD
jgi:hypothetical protein